MGDNQPNSWSEYQKLVIFRLDQLEAKVDAGNKIVDQVVTSIALLKFKVGMIATVAGFLAGAIVKAILR